MPGQPTQAFMHALHTLEDSRDLEPMLALFRSRARLTNLARTEQGQDAARRFWTAYRDQFAHVHSSFLRTIEADGHAVLVWTTDARIRKDARSLSYRGVSLLTFSKGKISEFETIYDTAAFLRPAAFTEGAGTLPEPRPTYMAI